MKKERLKVAFLYFFIIPTFFNPLIMKHFYLFLFFLLFMVSAVQAAPGDTTTVQAHIRAKRAVTGDYDTLVTFPTGTTTYRKIIMTFTLGKYQCPGSQQYCGDWDYSKMVYLVTPTKTLELGRMITPYANVSRFPWTWTHRFEFDVTDYALYLNGPVTIRITPMGPDGFTAGLKFDFIEGTPSRNVIAIERLWKGNFRYGDPAMPIETVVDSRSFQMPVNAQSAALKLYLTGHGANAADNCAEFCQKYYQVKVNNSLQAQQIIWRDDCGSNNLYPQTGTWVFERTNWCPGATVNPYLHPLIGINPGANFNVDVDFQPYTIAGGSQAAWLLEGQVIYYGTATATTDASLETIVSPSNHEALFRDNQVCQEPKIDVKNTGSATLTSLEIEYGLLNGTMHTYQWQGNIDPNEVSRIALPTVPEIQNVTGNNVKFKVRLTKANGQPDGNALNNVQTSTFTPLPIWPNNLVFTFTTNRSSSMGYNETSWKLYDAAGNIIKQRINNPSQATLTDTLALARGCYRLEMEDEGCDGINWWFYQYYQPNPGNGSFLVREKGRNNLIQMRGYFNGDFGCGFSQTFYVANALGITRNLAPFEVTVYPNPASEVLQVKVTGNNAPSAATFKLTNSLGQVVYERSVSATEIQVPVKNLASGIYLLTYQTGKYTVQKQVVVTH